MLDFFTLLTFFFFFPRITVEDNLVKENWGSFVLPVPGVDPRVAPIIYEGASLNFKMEITSLDTSTFKIFEGPEALAVLDVMVEHFILGKFLGPFPP